MPALIERIEHAEAELMALAAAAAHGRGEPGFVMPLAGGVATCAGPDSPFTKVAGLGFAGAPAQADLDEVERAFAAHGAPVQVEFAHAGDPAIGELLTARGYLLVGFEDVLALRLDREREPVAPPASTSPPSARTWSRRGSRSWPRASPIPTPRACPLTRSSRARPSSPPSATCWPPARHHTSPALGVS